MEIKEKRILLIFLITVISLYIHLSFTNKFFDFSYMTEFRFSDIKRNFYHSILNENLINFLYNTLNLSRGFSEFLPVFIFIFFPWSLLQYRRKVYISLKKSIIKIYKFLIDRV